MDLKPGVQLASATGSARIVVVKVPGDRQPVIACGGQPMVAPDQRGPAGAGAGAAPAPGGGVLLGKRYEADGVEVLCTASGEGPLTCDGEEMVVKAAKPLPASD